MLDLQTADVRIILHGHDTEHRCESDTDLAGDFRDPSQFLDVDMSGGESHKSWPTQTG